MTRAPILLSAGLLASILACTDAADPIPVPQDVVSAESEDLELSLSVAPRTISPGDSARFEITLRNTSQRRLHLEAGGCPLLYYVANASGEVVEPEGGQWACILILQQLELGPGESKDHVGSWSAESCRWVSTQRECTPLPAGEYRAYATFHAIEAGRERSLRTPELSVRVRG